MPLRIMTITETVNSHAIGLLCLFCSESYLTKSIFISQFLMVEYAVIVVCYVLIEVKIDR